jgi:hypothetical protein
MLKLTTLHIAFQEVYNNLVCLDEGFWDYFYAEHDEDPTEALQEFVDDCNDKVAACVELKQALVDLGVNMDFYDLDFDFKARAGL